MSRLSNCLSALGLELNARTAALLQHQVAQVQVGDLVLAELANLLSLIIGCLIFFLIGQIGIVESVQVIYELVRDGVAVISQTLLYLTEILDLRVVLRLLEVVEVRVLSHLSNQLFALYKGFLLAGVQVGRSPSGLLLLFQVDFF